MNFNTPQELENFLQDQKTQIQNQLMLDPKSPYWRGSRVTVQLAIEAVQSLIFNQQKSLHKQLFVAIADDKIVHIAPVWQPLIINSIPEVVNHRRYYLIAVVSEMGCNIQNCSTKQSSPTIEEIQELLSESSNQMLQSTLEYWQKNRSDKPSSVSLAHYLSMSE